MEWDIKYVGVLHLALCKLYTTLCKMLLQEHAALYNNQHVYFIA